MRTWIERQRHIVDFTLSSLLRRKGKNVALRLVYTLVVFTLASVVFSTRALREEAGLLLAGAPEVVVQRTVAVVRHLWSCPTPPGGQGYQPAAPHP